VGVCGPQLLGSLCSSMEKMNNWGVICGHQENGILLLGTRERNRIVMEMDVGAVAVGVLNKGTGKRNDHCTRYFV
jgi:hypothetical protein